MNVMLGITLAVCLTVQMYKIVPDKCGQAMNSSYPVWGVVKLVLPP